MAMVAAADKHFGQWLREQIERLGIKKQTAASKMGIAAVTLRAWFNQPAPGMAAHNKVQVANLLKVPVEEIEKRLNIAADAYRDQKIWEAGARTALEIQKQGRDAMADDRSVEKYSEEAWHEVPTFDLSVAAGQWIDVSDIQDICQDKAATDRGFFRIRIAGDSMKPDFVNGDLVEFRCLRVDREGPVVGREYYVQREDGQATFKRLEKTEGADEDLVLVLRAINVKKFKEPMPVRWGDVVRIAEAIATVKLRR